MERALLRDGGGVLAVGFDREGVRVAAGGYDERVRIWHVNGELLADLRGHLRSIHAVAFDPRGELLASGDGEDDEKPGMMILRELATGSVVVEAQRLHAWTLRAIAWRADGELLATAGYDGVVHLVGRDGVRRQTVAPDLGMLEAVAWSPDGATLAVAGAHGAALVDVASASVRPWHGHAYGTFAIAFDPAGTRVATGGGDGNVHVAAIAPGGDDGGEATTFAAHRGQVSAVAWLPDGGLVSAGLDGEVRIRDLASGAERAHTTMRRQVNAVAVARDGVVAIGCGKFWRQGELILWEHAPLRDS